MFWIRVEQFGPIGTNCNLEYWQPGVGYRTHKTSMSPMLSAWNYAVRTVQEVDNYLRFSRWEWIDALGPCSKGDLPWVSGDVVVGLPILLDPVSRLRTHRRWRAEIVGRDRPYANYHLPVGSEVAVVSAGSCQYYPTAIKLLIPREGDCGKDTFTAELELAAAVLSIV